MKAWKASRAHPPGHVQRVLAVMLKALRRQGVVAVNLFGDRDAWADVPERNFHTEAGARQLFAGLKILRFEVYTTTVSRSAVPSAGTSRTFSPANRDSGVTPGSLIRFRRGNFPGVPRARGSGRAKNPRCVTPHPAAQRDRGAQRGVQKRRRVRF